MHRRDMRVARLRHRGEEKVVHGDAGGAGMFMDLLDGAIREAVHREAHGEIVHAG